MSDLVRQGKILYWGTSEWSVTQITEAYNIAKQNFLVPPTMEQPQYNLLHRERVEVEYAPLYDHNYVGLGTTVWSPLASGLLTGKYNNAQPSNTRTSRPGMEWLKAQFENSDNAWKHKAVANLMKVANEMGTSIAILSIAWCLCNNHVSSVILGATKEEQLTENLKASELASQITDEWKQKIEAAVNNAKSL
jgi:Predicted oxidoreductases (related to aryl-alcohol dehydrogenases)